MITEELTIAADLIEEMDKRTIEHIPVMIREVQEALHLKKGGIFVDCTLGLGGHARSILNAIGPQGRLIAIDRDKESLQIAREQLREFSSQCEFVHADFRFLDRILNNLNIKEADGILLDLGISSLHLDNPQRGFSFQSDGPLDMRMDQQSPISAYDLVNSLSENEISTILKEYGEERWHKRIARYLVWERAKHPIETTARLREIILKAIPYRNYKDKSHPATRSFQALRIAVNRELESLERAMEVCVNFVKVGGRIVVISFHSLEDRIVKLRFRNLSQSNQVKILTKKPLRASEEEIGDNPRSRSARLRAAERIYSAAPSILSNSGASQQYSLGEGG